MNKTEYWLFVEFIADRLGESKVHSKKPREVRLIAQTVIRALGEALNQDEHGNYVGLPRVLKILNPYHGDNHFDVQQKYLKKERNNLLDLSDKSQDNSRNSLPDTDVV